MAIWGILLMIAVGIACYCFGNLHGMAWKDKNNAPVDKARQDYIAALERRCETLKELWEKARVDK